ncbi:MAG TPA: hypothetical protein VNK95_11490, partial [Caldilineaceae bacterium]|nr:hypothetical protein [Caldilineaceae bacterium]
MARNNRRLTRLYFILVLLMGLFGYWYAGNSWHVEAESLAALNLVEGGDWIGFFATLGEEVIQLFLG